MTRPSPHSPPRRAFPWWAAVSVVSALCLGAAFAVKAGWTGNRYVRKLAPNWEYTLGNWWSAMLLLAFALLSAQAAQRYQPGSKARRAVLILGLLGLGLGLDELGSLHERAADLIPGHRLLSLAPFAAVFTVATAWALRTLWCESRRLRTGCLLTCAALACMASTEPLDAFEHAHHLPQGWTKFGVVIEEGIELLGATLLIAAAVSFGRYTEVDPSDVDTPCAARRVGTWLLALTPPLLALRLTLQHTGGLDLHTRGDFGSAPAVMLLALVAWVLTARALARPGRIHLGLFVLATGVLLASIELGCNMYAWISRESVSSPLAVWWAQALLTGTAYSVLWWVTRLRPARGPAPADAA